MIPCSCRESWSKGEEKINLSSLFAPTQKDHNIQTHTSQKGNFMAGNLFYNATERRLRAFWRLLLQWLVFFGGNTVLSILLGMVVGIMMAVSGADLTDPAVIASINTNPLVQVFSAVSALVFMSLSLWVASRWLDKRPLRDFGFRFSSRWWADLGFGLFLGAFLMLVVFLVELSLGWVTVTGTLQSTREGMGFLPGILVYMVLFLCVGIYEEMLSRGYQLRNLAEGLHLGPISPRAALLLAYLISSSIFGLLHAGNPNATLISTVNLIVAGLFLGLGYVLTGELAIPIGLHITWNFFQGNVFGFPVSGMDTGATFIGIQQGGPELWTGGAFGPEAGLIGLAAIALGSVMTVLWVRWRNGRAGLCEELAVYTPPTPAPTAANLADATNTNA
jgi:membrane protease YdiL (CAAX protease family)